MIAKIISALLLAVSTTAALAQADAPLELADNAPDRHVVQKGDTLWDISGKFLKQPWRWPEIWNLNREQIRNPHLIYPGQVVYLDLSGGTPRLRLGTPVGNGKVEPRVYEESLSDAVPSIPQKIIEPFLIRPLVVDTAWDEGAPRVVALDEQRVVAGQGSNIYVVGLTGEDQRWEVYRPSRDIVDPETKQVIGREAEHLGTARLVRGGDPATLQVVTASLEIGRGDRLVPAPRPDIVNYAPHAPASELSGRVIGMPGGVSETGRNHVVMLNRGSSQGVEIGQVLALYRAGRFIPDAHKENARDTQAVGTDKKAGGVQLPDERYGLVFVFRVFEGVSYALVMNSDRPVNLLDTVRNP